MAFDIELTNLCSWLKEVEEEEESNESHLLLTHNASVHSSVICLSAISAIVCVLPPL